MSSGLICVRGCAPRREAADEEAEEERLLVLRRPVLRPLELRPPAARLLVVRLPELLVRRGWGMDDPFGDKAFVFGLPVRAVRKHAFV